MRCIANPRLAKLLWQVLGMSCYHIVSAVLIKAASHGCVATCPGAVAWGRSVEGGHWSQKAGRGEGAGGKGASCAPGQGKKGRQQMRSDRPQVLLPPRVAFAGSCASSKFGIRWKDPVKELQVIAESAGWQQEVGGVQAVSFHAELPCSWHPCPRWGRPSASTRLYQQQQKGRNQEQKLPGKKSDLCF